MTPLASIRRPRAHNGRKPLPKIFDIGVQVADRSATVASILALKGQDRKMTEVTALGAEDAAVAEAAGIEMVITLLN